MRTTANWTQTLEVETRKRVASSTAAITVSAQSSCTMGREEMRTTSDPVKSVTRNANGFKVRKSQRVFL